MFSADWPFPCSKGLLSYWVIFTLFFSMFLFIVKGRIYPLYLGFLAAKEGCIHSEVSHCFKLIFYLVAF